MSTQTAGELFEQAIDAMGEENEIELLEAAMAAYEAEGSDGDVAVCKAMIATV